MRNKAAGWSTAIWAAGLSGAYGVSVARASRLDTASRGPYASAMSDLNFVRVKGIALAVADLDRANRFYGETLGLPPDTIRHMASAYLIGDAIVMLKSQEEWYARPTDQLNPRITVETRDAFATEAALKERGVTISDPVTLYDGTPVGAFLDSEGNKIWFCSAPGKSGQD
ncbi:MAG: VOC family protein [Verrucomicrobiaceae bacterium]